jgi:Phosphatidylinositol-4-phosphate 5-Kinase
MLKILCSLSLRFCLNNDEYECYAIHNDFYFFEDQFLKIFANLKFRNLEKCKLYLVYYPDFLLVEYLPELFSQIRVKENFYWENGSSENVFLTSQNILNLKNMKNLDEDSSDTFLFTTSDEKFVIKTIKKQNKKQFLRMLGEYYDKVVNCLGTKLVKIFGLFTLKPGEIDFIIMENLIPNGVIV